MKRQTKRLLLFGVILVLLLAALGVTLLVRRRAAPEAARLLPGSDAVWYVNLRNIRRLTSFASAPTPKHEPEYDEFIRQTGFDAERDLDEVAMAVHLGVTVNGRTRENRYSEVLVGNFDHARVTTYLKKISRSVSSFSGTEIFEVPVEDRTVRVAILGIGQAAISNVDDPATIQGIIARSKHLALPPRGPALLAQHYHQVPVASLAWVIAHIPAATSGTQTAKPYPLPGGFDVLLPYDSTVVGSVRYLGTIRAKAEFLLANEQQARQFSDQANTFLNLFKQIETSVPSSGNDPDVKTVFDSLKMQQEKDHAVLTASIPPGFLKKFFAESTISNLEQKPLPETNPPKHKRKGTAKSKKH